MLYPKGNSSCPETDTVGCSATLSTGVSCDRPYKCVLECKCMWVVGGRVKMGFVRGGYIMGGVYGGYLMGKAKLVNISE